MRRKPSRALLVALSVSAALHGAGWVLLERMPDPAPTPPGPGPLWVEIREVERADRPAAPPSEPLSRRTKATAPAQSPGRRSTRPTGAGKAARAQPPSDSDIPLAGAAEPGAPSKAPGAALLPDGLAVLDRLEPPSPAAPPARGLQAPRPLAVDEQLTAITQEALGRHRVESGMVPTYFRVLKGFLVVAWDLERVLNQRARRGLAVPKTRTRLRLVQDPRGRLMAVEVLLPSQDPELDAEMVTDLRRVAPNLPAPTPDAIGARAQLASVWDFHHVPKPPIPPPEFDAVTLFDPRAIPELGAKRLELIWFE